MLSFVYILHQALTPLANLAHPRSLLDGSTSFPEEAQDEGPNNLESGAPRPYHSGSPVGVDLSDPFGSVTGWLNHEGVYDTLGLEGELDIIANSDENPTEVKIGALGYSSGGSAHTPFELLSETEAGSLVFLTPVELATSQTSGSFEPSAEFTNHSMAMVVTRSAPLSLGFLPNLNLTSVNPVAGAATQPPDFIHVLINVGPPSSSSGPENLCATFYAHLAQNHTDDDPPMFLELCDNSFIPGGLPSAVSLTGTQIWQYDRKTHELKPMLRSDPGMNAEAASSSSQSDHSGASGVVAANRGTAAQTFSSSTGKARTTTVQSSAVTQQVQSYTSNTIAPTSSIMVTPSQISIRRNEKNRVESNESTSATYVVVPVVEPYTLVFVPRTAPGAGTILPDSPV